jgi:hypothetical protein
MIVDYLMLALAGFAMIQGVLRLWMLNPIAHKLWYGVIYVCIIVGAITALFYPKQGATILLFGICVSLVLSRKSWLDGPPPAARK